MESNTRVEILKEFGYSPIKRFWYSLFFYENIVNRVYEIYPDGSVNNLKGYVAQFCKIRLKSFETFINVLVDYKDYVTANCILRMLGDGVSVFRLIYMEKDNDYRILRHCLYVIEGCEKNLEVIPENNINEGFINDEQFEELKPKIRFNRELRERMKNEAQSMLDVSPLRNVDMEAFNKIVKDRNWKFKEFSSKSTKKNQYSWHELYDMICKCNNFDLLTYISQYVHCLSMSNLFINVDEQNIDSVIPEVVGLIDRMIDYMSVFFADKRLFILEGLFEPDMRDKILACYDEKHRPTIEQWNNMVLSLINA